MKDDLGALASATVVVVIVIAVVSSSGADQQGEQASILVLACSRESKRSVSVRVPFVRK